MLLLSLLLLLLLIQIRLALEVRPETLEQLAPLESRVVQVLWAHLDPAGQLVYLAHPAHQARHLQEQRQNFQGYPDLPDPQGFTATQAPPAEQVI